MKKTLIIIATIISLVSCSKEKEIISKSEEYLKKDLLDPKSYELIESRLDTMTKSDGLEALGYSDSIIGGIFIERAEHETKYAKIWIGSTSAFGQYNFNDHIKKGDEYLDSAKKYMKMGDEKKKQAKLLKGTDKDSITRFVVKLKYYSVNKKGERGITTSYVGVHKSGEPVEVFNLD